MLKSFSHWWTKIYESSGLKNSKLRQSYLRPGWQKARQLPWRRWFGLGWVVPGLETLVSVILKLGTLALVSFFLLFFIRLFKDQGYVLQSFSVPKTLEEQGYSGQIIALRVQDELTVIKEIAESVKEDSIQLKEAQGDIDLSVLGVGLSLRSLAFQLRELMGRGNKTLRGEITRVGQHFEAQIRMTGYPKIVKETDISTATSEHEAIDILVRQMAEGILFNTDPYRLALLCRKEKRYEEATAHIRHILRTNEQEAHWAYLCWGSMLNEMGKREEAIAKFEKAIQIKPDFSLPYVNVSWLYANLDRHDEGIAALEEAIRLEPDNVWRYNSLAWMLHNDEQYERADSLYRIMMAHPLCQESTQLQMDLATSWAEMKMQRDDIPGAKTIIDTYVNDLGENILSYLVKGISAFSEQDTVNALKYLAQAFEIDPSDNAAINSNIGLNKELGYCENSVDFYQRASWGEMNMYNKMSSWNQVAMCFNELGQYDSAYALVHRVIEIDPEMSFPYTTLAENYAFRNELDSCYLFLDKAFAMGFDLKFIPLDESPYKELQNDFTFQQLMKKYSDSDTDI